MKPIMTPTADYLLVHVRMQYAFTLLNSLPPIIAPILTIVSRLVYLYLRIELQQSIILTLVEVGRPMLAAHINVGNRRHGKV